MNLDIHFRSLLVISIKIKPYAHLNYVFINRFIIAQNKNEIIERD